MGAPDAPLARESMKCFLSRLGTCPGQVEEGRPAMEYSNLNSYKKGRAKLEATCHVMHL
jgi:hypothetical protein